MSDPSDELEFTFEGENITISLDDFIPEYVPNEKAEEPEGRNCSRCNEFYKYAKANQTNGTFKCWGCRH